MKGWEVENGFHIGKSQTMMVTPFPFELVNLMKPWLKRRRLLVINGLQYLW